MSKDSHELRADIAQTRDELRSDVDAIVDKVSPEFHELAGRAKDMGSAAVFLLMLMVGISWALILIPRYF